MSASEASSAEGCDLDRGFEILRSAVASQKRGQSVSDLWAELFVVCGADPVATNQLVREFSDALTQGYPKLDVHNYQESITAKAKEHEYLLYALHDGLCFTNRKVNSDTYTALFENEERLSAVRAVAPFVGDALFEGVMKEAGKQIRAEWVDAMNLELGSSLDRFFASVHESPEQLAQSIALHCDQMEHKRGHRSDRSVYEWLQKLFSMASEMFSAVKIKRHDLNLRYGRERVLAGEPVTNWMLSTHFHVMWDRLLYFSTQLLEKVTPGGFEGPMAKPVAMLCIQIAERLCDFLTADTQTEDGSMYFLVDEDFLDLPDRYVAAIVAQCFGCDRSPKADDEILKQLVTVCKAGRCYSSIFMLLYICLDRREELYQLMIDWQCLVPRNRTVPFAGFVFEKWYMGGTRRDLDHLLNGPAELDNQLVEFLTENNNHHLASTIRMRMGDSQGAADTLMAQAQPLDEERDIPALFLFSSCSPQRDEDERRMLYLQMKLNCICHRFNLIATRPEAKDVLHELLYMMHREANYNLIHSALDIFIYSSPEFCEAMREQWDEMWMVMAHHMKLEAVESDSLSKYYQNEDFCIMQKAVQMMKLPEFERQRLFSIVHIGLQKRFPSTEIPDGVEEFISTGFEVAIPGSNRV